MYIYFKKSQINFVNLAPLNPDTPYSSKMPFYQSKDFPFICTPSLSPVHSPHSIFHNFYLCSFVVCWKLQADVGVTMTYHLFVKYLGKSLSLKQNIYTFLYEFKSYSYSKDSFPLVKVPLSFQDFWWKSQSAKIQHYGS